MRTRNGARAVRNTPGRAPGRRQPARDPRQDHAGDADR